MLDRQVLRAEPMVVHAAKEDMLVEVWSLTNFTQGTHPRPAGMAYLSLQKDKCLPKSGTPLEPGTKVAVSLKAGQTLWASTTGDGTAGALLGISTHKVTGGYEKIMELLLTLSGGQ